MKSKSMQVILSGAITNYSDLTNEKFFELLKEKSNDIELYKFQPQTGKIYNAAFDWQIVSTVADILGIVSFIWQVYAQVILPNKEKNPTGGIYLNIENTDPSNTIWIGHNIQSEKNLKTSIENTLKQLEIDALENKKKVDYLRESTSWKKI